MYVNLYDFCSCWLPDISSHYDYIYIIPIFAVLLVIYFLVMYVFNVI